MKIFYTPSIRLKLIYIILFVSTFVIITNISINSLIAVKSQKNDLKNESVLMAKLIAEFSVPPLMFNQKEGAKEILSKLQRLSFKKSTFLTIDLVQSLAGF